MANGFNRALKWSRVVAQIVVFLLLTAAITMPALYVRPVDTLLCRLQLIPAILTMTLSIFVMWLVVTLVFGRIYCSTVCPAGTLMDLSARMFHRNRSGKRKIYRYDSPRLSMRYFWLLIMMVGLIGGISVIVSILDPYHAFDRICTSFFAPIVDFVATTAKSLGINMPVSRPTATVTVASSIIATLLFSIIMVSGALTGRSLCNTICPVGTTLGFVSRYSIFQMDIDTDLCTQCRRCVDVCKSHCIDITDHVVDGSRCVDCFNCIAVCPNKAIRYTTSRKQLSDPLMQPLDTPGGATASSIDSPK